MDVSDAEYVRLLTGQATGMAIVPDSAGNPILIPRQQTNEQITQSLTAAVQSHMDEQARACGYDDIKSAVTYADEPAVPKFQAEGQVFREWRSMCWGHCYGVLDAMNAGEREIPTSAELIAELPPLALPA